MTKGAINKTETVETKKEKDIAEMESTGMTVPDTGSEFGAIETPGNLLDIDMMMNVASVSASTSSKVMNLNTRYLDDEQDDNDDLWSDNEMEENRNGITPMGITDDGPTMR